ncbi:MAG TPA: RagB/SusD family nutrient uptake outer membrane protein [Prolixibacteraceae bacterium]|nr:RagB/SusD family nutrient uptake outer membrane protein [Prolixibacteraceae bacterium]
MKILKNIIVFTGLVFLFLSCENFLDEVGYNCDYTYYETAEGLDALVASSYQQTRWCAAYETQYALEDMGTDIYMLAGDGSHRDAFGQYLSTSMTPQYNLLLDFWNNNYKGIASANLAIEYLEKDTKMLDHIRPVRMGEALFLRAYYYYELVIQFGDIPLNLKPTDEPKTDFHRVPQKEVWSQIIADLTKAWELLPWADDGKVTGNFGRVSKGAAGHLLAKAYMFRYCDKYAKNQSDANMNEDRGGMETDIDSVIYYASRVCNFGDGAGSGSTHVLASDFSTLWGWDQKLGLIEEYMGPEILFTINFSTDHFYNNVNASSVNDGGNWLHLFYAGQNELYPLTTTLESGEDVAWGNNIGFSRNIVSGRPWRRLCPTPYYYSEDGLYAARNYESGKLGKLVDSRLYKSHVWVYYCNDTIVDVPWMSYSNAAGSFDPASIGMVEGEQRYDVGDTCLVLSVENVSKRFSSGTDKEKLALARAQEKYWYVPMQSIKVPDDRAEVAGYDVITNTFPTLTKHLDSRRAAVQDQAGFKNLIRMRLGETFILLSEAYARKGDFSNAAAALNKVRERAAWKEGEEKYIHYWKYDGGSYESRKASTVNDMLVSAGFIGSFTGDNLTHFYLDEMGHETAGELNRFDLLARYGADYWKNKIEASDYWTVGYIQVFHRFRPIPQSHIDNIDPADPNPQNYGY